MLVECICGKISEYTGNKEVCEVLFDWYELEKKRIRKTAQDGTEIGIALEEPMMEGDILGESEEKIYVVVLKECDLIKLSIDSMEEMGRAGFELGNRHMSLEIGNDYIKTVYDPVTYEYLVKKGFVVEKVHERFAHYIVCRGHDHSHAHNHEHYHVHSHEHHQN